MTEESFHKEVSHGCWTPELPGVAKPLTGASRQNVQVVRSNEAAPSRFETFMASALHSVFGMCKANHDDIRELKNESRAKNNKLKGQLHEKYVEVSDDEPPLPSTAYPLFAFPEQGYEDYFTHDEHDSE